MNAARLLDISEVAEMLDCDVGKVRKLVIEDRTLTAIHVDLKGHRKAFKIGGLWLYDVDNIGGITDRRTGKPDGFLRFDLEEVVRTLSKHANESASCAPLLEITSVAPTSEDADHARTQRAQAESDRAVAGKQAKIVAPQPLITGHIAFCFAGLGWSEKGWKRPLGDKPKWIQPCVVIPGVRGVSQTRWNPVLIGAALACRGLAEAKSVRAKFQTQLLLKPWFDEWQTYEADYLSAD